MCCRRRVAILPYSVGDALDSLLQHCDLHCLSYRDKPTFCIFLGTKPMLHR